MSPSAIWAPWFHQTARAGRDTRDTDFSHDDDDDDEDDEDEDDDRGSTKQLAQAETLATLIIVMMMMVSNSCVQINEESEFGIHIVDNTICKFSAQGRDKFYMSPKHFLSNVRQDIQSLLV